MFHMFHMFHATKYEQYPAISGPRGTQFFEIARPQVPPLVESRCVARWWMRLLLPLPGQVDMGTGLGEIYTIYIYISPDNNYVNDYMIAYDCL